MLTRLRPAAIGPLLARPRTAVARPGGGRLVVARSWPWPSTPRSCRPQEEGRVGRRGEVAAARGAQVSHQTVSVTGRRWPGQQLERSGRGRP
jgi:hypothetical protein